jgi:hypothetical protein
MDADYGRNLDEEGNEKGEFENALFVASTVMSASAPGRAVVDAGHKASAIDSGLPAVWKLADTEYVGASDEHGKLSVGAKAAKLALGDRVWLVPGHVDPTVNLHDWYVGVRGGLEEGVVECLFGQLPEIDEGAHHAANPGIFELFCAPDFRQQPTVRPDRLGMAAHSGVDVEQRPVGVEDEGGMAHRGRVPVGKT